MKTKIKLATLALLLLIVHSPLSTTFSQGALTPPGAPTPTMKTLAQVEPRTAISSLPFHVTNSGSYYFTGNLTNSSGNGISISASDVTVDLNGFTLFGGAGSGSGVVVNDGLHDITLMNGTVRNWGFCGVHAFTALGVVCERLRALGNNGGGLGLSTNGVARQCLAQDNTYYGIYAASGSVVEDCSICNNSADGIQAESNCLLLNNYLSGNNTNLLNNAAAINVTGTGCRVEGNHVVNNLLKGVQDLYSGGGNVIIRNTARGNAVTNYSLSAASAFGPLVTTFGVLTNNPWANFSY